MISSLCSGEERGCRQREREGEGEEEARKVKCEEEDEEDEDEESVKCTLDVEYTSISLPPEKGHKWLLLRP